MTELPGARDKLLFTPGPLTTSRTVKAAQLVDLGSRDQAFLDVVADVRRRLLALAGTSQPGGFEAIPMQGSGTFAIEAVVSSVVPRAGRLLVAQNGAYGRRIATIAARHGIEVHTVEAPENEPLDADAVARALETTGADHLAVVHCETTSGVMNPVEALGSVARAASARYLVDSMSAFGAVPVDLPRLGADYLVSSANKAIEGVPGFAFVLARREALLATEGTARTVSLDLLAQWRGLEKDGQFRFTPPTHAILAFHRALLELEAEGGVAARGARYAGLQRRLREGMAALGFREYVAREHQGPVITTFLEPDDPAFTFEDFYARLNARDLVIYPGKVTDARAFRIGSIGRLFPPDVESLLAAIRDVLGEMGVK